MFSRKAQNVNLDDEIVNQMFEFIHCMHSPRSPIRMMVKRICWEKPQEGWMKLNTDGSSVGNPGLVGCGGIVRDNHGRWISGFSRHIETTNSFVAELWGFRDGLMLCSNLNILSLVVELDAKAIVDVLCRSDYVNNVMSPILNDCRLLIVEVQIFKP